MMHLKDLHAFRGFAIINIVAAHAGAVIVAQYYINNKLRSPSWNNSYAVSETLFHDSTLYFTLISGLLFSAVLVNKGWRAFFTSKYKNVLLPYILMSALFTAFNWGFAGRGLIVFPFDSGQAYISAFTHNLLLGTAEPQYWYIPTLMVLYLLTPLAWIVGKVQPRILILLGVLPLFLARSSIDLSFQSVGYFFGAYCLGIGLGCNYDYYVKALARWRWPLAIVIALTSVALFFIERKSVPMEPLGLVGESLFYIQKIAVAGLVLSIFSQWQARLPKLLSTLASYAFAIYFVHFFFVKIFVTSLYQVVPTQLSGPVNALLDLCCLVFVLAISLAIGMLIKKLTGRFSRQIIGA